MKTNRAELSVEEKIGQLFFIGISGPDFDQNTENLIREIKPGGICLFARNIREPLQTRNLLDSIRSHSVVPPLLSVDQEGGLVDRIKRIFTPMPAADKIRTKENAATLARITAQVLLMLGFNMNFAPVVDVVDGERKNYTNGLYSRAFGNSADETAELAARYLYELEAHGCIGCLKHFPGLGASQADSHDELPTVLISRDEFFAKDILPYRRLIEAQAASAVMVAHANFPKLNLRQTVQNGKILPSSLDHTIVTSLLRHELGSQGLVITDDLEMGAITKNFDIGEACVLAIEAGVDMLAVCAGEDAIRKGSTAVSAAVERGRITVERLDASIDRIFALKKRIKEPAEFDVQRFAELSTEMEEFRNTLI